MPRVTPLMLLAVIVATSADAQPAGEARHDQSIGAAAQWALPFSGRGAEPGVEASWRRWFSSHLGVGADFRWGIENATIEYNSPAQVSIEGVRIPAQQGRDDRRIASYGLGASIFAKGSAGRLSLIAGAGPGLFLDRTMHETLINGMHHSRSATQRSFGLHLLLEVDVRASDRLSAFIGLRSELADLRDLESSFGYPTAGVRFAF